MRHLCIGGLVAAALLLVVRQFTGGSAEDVVLDWGFEETVGRRIGQAIVDDLAAGDLRAEDDKIVVAVYNFPPVSENWKRQAKAYWNGIVDQVKGTDVSVVACADEFAEEAHAWLTGNATGSDDLLAIMRRAAASVPEAQVFVTFFGLPPQATAADLSGLPPIYALESSRSDPISTLLREGALRGVVTTRDDADWKAKPDPGRPWDVLFDQQYEYIESPAR